MATATADDLAGLSIQASRRTGFSESTLRYYERIGLIGPVPRVTSSSHRRYAAGDCRHAGGAGLPAVYGHEHR